MVYCVVGSSALRNVSKLNFGWTHAVASWSDLYKTDRTGFVSGAQFHSDGGLRRFACYNLQHRALLRVQGQDTGAFLQGLITNDINLVMHCEHRALYTHMLNVQGRTLFDLIIYSLKNQSDTETGVLLECDSAAKDSVQKHLKMYKIRREVDVVPCANLTLWAVIPLVSGGNARNAGLELLSPDSALVFETDPRTEAMGWRIVVDGQVNPEELIKSCQQREIEEYHRHRYTIGVPEGVKDLPPGMALPLEANLVYLQGVSFTKGCYIGQELTARTHHTGVVRKRLMPVRVSKGLVQDLPEGASLLTRTGKAAGKYVSSVGDRGLSLVRLAHAKEPLVLRTSQDTEVTLQASVPDWWPKEGQLS